MERRIIDLRRDQIIRRAKKAEKDYKDVKVFIDSVADLIKAAIDND